jgi:DNA-binding NtrC family response regulator
MIRLADTRVLLVDDDVYFTATLSDLISDVCRLDVVHDIASARHRLATDPPDLILLDIEFEDGRPDGFTLLEQLQGDPLAPPILMLTGTDEAAPAVRAIQAGAFHYLTKMPSFNQLVNLMTRALEHHQVRRRLAAQDAGGGSGEGDETAVYIGESRVSRELLATVRELAVADCRVLITGETGTGKGVIARLLHDEGPRAEEVFLPVPLAALAHDLIASELFGHVRGAFANAVSDRSGKFDLARRGTIFLDDITDASGGIQSSLLQVIEEGRFHRVGADEMVATDARVLAATNKDVEAEVRAGRFKADLFHRLRTFWLHLPPLRERREDILPVARHYLARFAQERNKDVRGFTASAERLLQDHPWPGNIRELKQAVERAVIFARGPLVHPGLLAVAAGPTVGSEPEPLDAAFERARVAFWRDYYAPLLERTGGSVEQVARLAGKPRQTVYRHLEQAGLDWREFGDPPSSERGEA